MSSSHLSSSRRDHGKRGVLRLTIALPIVALLVVALAQTAFASGPGNASVIVTPASGPAGTRVTVTGAHFTPNTPVTVGYSKTDCKAGVIAIDGTDQTTAADGSVTVTVTWPSTENGKYVICVTEKGTGKVHQSDTQFEALSASAASINITQTVRSAGKVTVTGANYLPGGSSFEVLYGAAGSNGCANSVATGTVNADGTFSATFDAPFVQADTTYQVTAVSPAKTCGAGAVLAASKSLTVTAASDGYPNLHAKARPIAKRHHLPWHRRRPADRHSLPRRTARPADLAPPAAGLRAWTAQEPARHHPGAQHRDGRAGWPLDGRLAASAARYLCAGPTWTADTYRHRADQRRGGAIQPVEGGNRFW